MNSCYIRPIALRGYGDIGVGGLAVPTEVYIACWEWGRYLGPEAIENGVDVCVSSWNRMAPNTLPSMAKAAANYMNSQLIHMEAHANGYSEGIALDTNGFVSEGSGENIFVAMDGVLYHAAHRSERPARHHAQFRDDAVRRPENSGSRTDDSARNAVPRRRSFLHRNRGGNQSRCARSTASRSAKDRAGPSPRRFRKNFSPFSTGRSPTATTG